jgi:hypothetical protein
VIQELTQVSLSQGVSTNKQFAVQSSTGQSPAPISTTLSSNNSTASVTTPPELSGGGLSGGAIGGIVGGVVGGLLLVAAAAFLVLVNRGKSASQARPVQLQAIAPKEYSRTDAVTSGEIEQNYGGRLQYPEDQVETAGGRLGLSG